jgi:hypothetical protein
MRSDFLRRESADILHSDALHYMLMLWGGTLAERGTLNVFAAMANSDMFSWCSLVWISMATRLTVPTRVDARAG